MTGLPPIQWFRNPELTELTPLTVDRDGRVRGHLCGWDTDHMSFPGRRIRPPRSRSDYSYFHVGAATVVSEDGAEIDIPVGRLVMGSGHAGTSLSAQDTAEFYDTTSTVAAVCCVGEDAFGVYVAGALMPDLDEMSRRRFKACALSGDWRAVNGHLELVAALAVATPGFAIPRARVASGAPMALVAAGVVQPERGQVAFARRVDPAWSLSQRPMVVRAARELPLDPATFADQIAERLDERRRAGELTAQQEALLADLDESPIRAAALLAELDETESRFAAAVAAFGAGDVDPKG